MFFYIIIPSVMKRIYALLFLMLVFGVQVLTAQTLGNYTFSTGTDATKWIPLTTTTNLLTNGSGSSTHPYDSRRSAVLDIGFAFTFGGEQYTKFSVNSDGNLRFGTTVTGFANNSTPFSSNNSNANNPKINFFGANGDATDSGYVRKEIVGVEPNRICVFEFATSTTYSSSSTATHGILYRWQVQLFEESNNIQIVYPSTVPSTGPSATRQQGMCVNNSDIWLVKANNTATHYTSGQSTTIASGNWPGANRYYLFTAPGNGCPNVTDMHVREVTGSTALLTWSSSFEANSWEVYVTTSSTAPTASTNPTYTSTDTFQLMSNLTPATLYNVYVRSVCGGVKSFWRKLTFHTALTQLPFFCDFETVPSDNNPLPAGWIRGSVQTYPYVNSASGQAYDGSKALYFFQPNYVAMPPIDPDYINLQNSELSFYAKANNSGAVLQVGVMTDPEDAATFEVVSSLVLTDQYQLYEVPLADYSGTGTYIAFRNVNLDIMRLDNLTLGPLSACSKPTRLTAVPEIDQATLEWFSTGTSFNLYYKVPSASGYTVIQNVQNNYQLTNLTENTDYMWYVAARCGDTLKTSSVSTFHTLCELIPHQDLPFVETFDSCATTADLNTCFTRLSLDLDYPKVYSSTNWNGVTAKTIFFLPNSDGEQQYLVLPGIHNVSALTVNFYTKRGSYNAAVDLGVMDNPYDTASFYLIGTYGSVPGTSDWSNFEVPLAGYPGTGNYIAFRAHNNVGGLYVQVDDITVSVSSGCDRPDSVAVENVTANSAQIHIYDPANSGSYQVIYTSVYSQDTVVVNSNIATLTGLRVGTVYDVSVSSVCNGGITSSVTVTFSTSCAMLTHNDLPFEETFDLYAYNANAAINPCWHRLSYNPQYPVGPYPRNQYTRIPGVGNTFYFYPGVGEQTQYAILPQMQDISDLMIDLWVYRQNNSPLIDVGVMTNPADTTTFELIQTCVPPLISTWDEFEVSFASYTGQGTYIALRARATGNAAFICVDDIVVREDNCLRPSALRVTPIGHGAITFSWDSVPGVPGYEFVLEGVDTQAVTANSYTVYGLPEFTDYTARVRSLCGSINSGYASAHFTTPCDTLPYYQNFNLLASSGAIPPGWKKMGAGSLLYATSGSYVYDAVSLRFTGSATNNIAVLPNFPAPVQNLYLQFMTRPEGTSASAGAFDVGYVTDVADTTSFVPVETYTYNEFNDAYQQKYVNFTTVPDNARIAFRHRSESITWYWFVDNVEVGYDQCPSVGSVTVEDVQYESATVSWNGVAQGIQYLLNLNGQTFTTADTFYTFTNLYQGADYTLTVNTLCANDTSHGAEAHFTTLLSAHTLPYVADFGAADGWLVNRGVCSNYWTKGMHNGEHALFVTGDGHSAYYNVTGISSVAAEKYLQVGDAPKMMVSFDLKCGGESSYDYLKIFLAPMSEEYAPSTASTVTGWADKANSNYAANLAQYITQTGTSSSYPYIINLVNGTLHLDLIMDNPVQNPDPSSEAKLVFGWRNDVSGGTQPGAVITNLRVKPYTCAAPTTLTVSNIQANTADLAWTDTANTSSYMVEYVESGLPWNDPSAVSIYNALTTLTLQNLAPATTYKVRVATDCITDTSVWITKTFTTDSAVILTPPSVQTQPASQISDTAAMLKGVITNPDEMAIAARGFEWKETAGGSYVVVNVTSQSDTFTYTLSGLAPATGYTYKAFVEADGEVIYGNEVTFTTDSALCPAPTNLEETGEVIDKAPGYLFVRWTDNAGASQWNLQYRIQGTEDWTTMVVNTTYEGISGLEAYATYELRVQAICGDGIVSDWSNILVAVAQGAGIEDYLAKSVTLYPNPATSTLNVVVSDASIRITGVEIYDVYGQMINVEMQGMASPQVPASPQRINISSLASGVYYVRIVTDDGLVTKPFVKK